MKVAVIGGGSWGGALAVLLNDNGCRVAVWEFDARLVERYKRGERENPLLPGSRFPLEVRVENDLEPVLEGAGMVLLAVPSHVLREVLGGLRPLLPRDTILVDVAKGIEQKTLLRMSELAAECLPGHDPACYVCLSGPSHAEEVSRRLPTTIVAAAREIEQARRVQSVFANEVFRVYTNDDLVGVELGGALKNVVALASGMCDGLGFGDNTKGALLTRGMVEIARLGQALGGRPETFWGLSGMGDLITTCMSRHSRNRHVGEELGRGRPLKEILAGMSMVAEGVRTTDSAWELAGKHGVQMPITQAVHRILFESARPREEVYRLMTRTLKEER